MQGFGTDITEITLPERWAVLEQALRQMNAEEVAPDFGTRLDEAEPVEGVLRHRLVR